MFELNDVSFHLEGWPLLHSVSLQIPRGQMVGLIGHSGSGKSTLLGLLARQLVPSGGLLRLDERPLAAWSAREFAGLVAYLPQRVPATCALRVRELVGSGCHPWRGLLGRFAACDRLQAERVLELTDTADLAEQRVDRLSDGERQRVWLAMLLARDTRYLLLDEPVAALDLARRLETLARLRELSRQLDLGVVVALHDINLAARYCDRLIALHGGRLLVSGSPSALMNPATLEAIHGIPMRVLQHPDSGHPIAVAQ
ncbi:ABC transporter ATP-binding protein [Azotobacter salinestris]|uniref:ABC transporter ATP-binding protein n=1 Tax=Azotobacter salinestris TaxID=69964 RepID=UPI0012669D28|nr:ATP-binding cassette domain-containing protein [Azotobacter salinestris]